MFFNLMKNKVTLHKDFLPADYNYWKDNAWLNRSFYSENGIPRIKSMIAKFLVSRKVNKIGHEIGLKATPL